MRVTNTGVYITVKALDLGGELVGILGLGITSLLVSSELGLAPTVLLLFGGGLVLELHNLGVGISCGVIS